MISRSKCTRSRTFGFIAIQLAKLSGFNPIITTCSKSNESYCLSAGATHVIDYKTVPYTSLASHITSNITSKPFKVIYDAVSTEDSQAASWSILSDTEGLGSKAGTGGKLVITLPPAKSISSELDEKQLAKNGSKSASWAYGNGNGQPTQADANKLARALEGWLIEGKIKVCVFPCLLTFFMEASSVFRNPFALAHSPLDTDKFSIST